MKQIPSNRADREPDTVATPEGDGEFDALQPLTADAVQQSLEGLQVPRGAAPSAYEADKPSEMSEMIETLDEVSRGKLIP
jgi:hypothetical protein